MQIRLFFFVFFKEPVRSLEVLKTVLDQFSELSGYKINDQKSIII